MIEVGQVSSTISLQNYATSNYSVALKTIYPSYPELSVATRAVQAHVEVVVVASGGADV